MTDVDQASVTHHSQHFLLDEDQQQATMVMDYCKNRTDLGTKVFHSSEGTCPTCHDNFHIKLPNHLDCLVGWYREVQNSRNSTSKLPWLQPRPQQEEFWGQ